MNPLAVTSAKFLTFHIEVISEFDQQENNTESTEYFANKHEDVWHNVRPNDASCPSRRNTTRLSSVHVREAGEGLVAHMVGCVVRNPIHALASE